MLTPRSGSIHPLPHKGLAAQLPPAANFKPNTCTLCLSRPRDLAAKSPGGRISSGPWQCTLIHVCRLTKWPHLPFHEMMQESEGPYGMQCPKGFRIFLSRTKCCKSVWCTLLTSENHWVILHTMNNAYALLHPPFLTCCRLLLSSKPLLLWVNHPSHCCCTE